MALINATQGRGVRHCSQKSACLDQKESLVSGLMLVLKKNAKDDQMGIN
jgi:hypothetical protein